MAGLDITPASAPGRQLIQAYGDGGFRVSGRRHAGSLLVFRERALAWAVKGRDDVTVESLSAVIEAGDAVRILLIGAGRGAAEPLPAVRDALREHGVVAEWMDTGAACRTFNVLASEDRQVAAALIAVD